VGEEEEFFLRLFTEQPITSEEMDEETKLKKPPSLQSAPESESTQSSQDITLDTFKELAGEDVEVDAYELQKILNSVFIDEIKFDGFTADTCRLLVAIRDYDNSGKLNYEEFKQLLQELNLWKLTFKNQDTDKSGNFDSFELREALRDLGISVSNSVLTTLVKRYSHKDGKIYFDDYVHLVAKLTNICKAHSEKDNSAAEINQVIQKRL